MNFHRLNASSLIVVLGFALTMGTTAGFGDEPPKGEADPKSRQLLDEVIAAYKALPAYVDQGEFMLDMSVQGKGQIQKLPLRVTLVRPDKLVLETGVCRVVSDGKTLTTVVNPLKKYSSGPAPKTVTFDTVFTGGPLGSSIFGGPSSPMMLIVLNMLVGTDPAKALLDLGDRMATLPDRDFDSKSCRVLKVDSQVGGLAYHLLIDPETKLLRGIDLIFDPKALADGFPADQKVRLDAFRWTAGPVTTKPPADITVFAFEPPKGFEKVDAVTAAEAGQPGAEEPKFKIQSFLDKPAPEFTLTVFDGPDKTKTVSKADLAGKVVMIDFWATWCGPCLEELPEVQKLIEAYAKDKKELVVVALSQDNDPKDPAEVRKLIEETLDKKKIVLTGNSVGKIGLDPSNSVGDVFQVEGYPSVVLIDAKGTVRSAHVGFSPEIGKTLAKELDALLDGKPIPKEKADETK